jgi:hypothetical protein
VGDEENQFFLCLCICNEERKNECLQVKGTNKSPGGILRTRTNNQQQPKYQVHFGQHLAYMYLLPEVEQTYLKHPIPPHPPQPAQFHTPLGERLFIF